MNAFRHDSRHAPSTRPTLRLTLLALVLAAAQPGHAEKVADESAREPERPAATATPKLLSLSLQPRAVTLRGKEASQQFLLTGAYSDGVERDLSRQARFSLSDLRPARVDDRGQVFALAGGEARLTAEFGGLSAESTINVQSSASTRAPSFALDLEGIFTRQGCSDSHCHGSVKGRGGFKLSSQAGNPREDHRWIVRGGTFQIYSQESAGPETPRIRPEKPEESLLLLKPTLQVPHGGGRRLEPDGPDYRALLEWIGRGAPYGNGVPEIVRLEVMPRRIVLEPEQSQQLVVTAWLSDGSREDFTRRVRYQPTANEVVEVEENGLIRALEPGEATVLVQAPRLATRVSLGVVSSILTEFPREIPRNFIDEEVRRKLRRLSILPSEHSSDQEFLRRVCLDLTGTLPPPTRVREFLDSRDPAKRDRLITTLLNSPEYIDYWTFRLADLFRVSHEQGGRDKVKIYWEWIRDAIARNKPFDQVARERMAGQGYDGPTRHLWGADEIRLPQDVMTEQARVFLGRRLDCAQCHDHPFDSWTQDQFWGLTGFFKNLTYFWTTMAAVDDPIGHEEFGADGRLLHPRTKQEVEAIYPDGRALPVEERTDPRPRLADWFTSSEDYLFEEAMVNRFWSYFFGRGIVDPGGRLSTDQPAQPSRAVAEAGPLFSLRRIRPEGPDPADRAVQHLSALGTAQPNQPGRRRQLLPGPAPEPGRGNPAGHDLPDHRHPRGLRGQGRAGIRRPPARRHPSHEHRPSGPPPVAVSGYLRAAQPNGGAGTQRRSQPGPGPPHAGRSRLYRQAVRKGRPNRSPATVDGYRQGDRGGVLPGRPVTVSHTGRDQETGTHG